jgi:hypothetical protein
MVSSGGQPLSDASPHPTEEESDKASPAVSPRRAIAFVIVLVVCVAGALGYVVHVSWRAKAAAAALPPIAVTRLDELPAPPGAEVSVAKDGSPRARPYLLFRSTALGETYGRVSTEHLDARDGQRMVSSLQCERVHFAVDRGICLEAKRGALTTYHAHIFDRRLAITHSYPLAGPPSRARMSADGRLAAVTVFVTGHSYASTGFVTRTSVIDAAGGHMLVDDLEKFAVLREGEAIKAADFNFWGVTFTRDGQRFYATLGTAGKTWLVEGDLAARRMRVLHADVECPSLSPDNTMVAFKRRESAGGPGRFIWRLHVLTLASGKETALVGETRNVDDQVEWLANRELLYAMPEDTAQASAATHIWALPVDGTGTPRLVTPLAFSPAVVP